MLHYFLPSRMLRNFLISLLNKRWEVDNKIHMPSRLWMSPANFSVGHFFPLKTKQKRWFDGSEQEAIFKWHHYLSGLTMFYSLVSLPRFRAWVQCYNFLADDFSNASQIPRSCPDQPPGKVEANLLCDLLSQDENWVWIHTPYNQVHLISVSPMG